MFTWSSIPGFWSPTRLQAGPLHARQAAVAQGEDGDIFYLTLGGSTPLLTQGFAANTPVSGVVGSPDRVDIFAVGPDGRCLTSFNPSDRSDSGWVPWQPVADGLFTEGTPIAVAQSRPGWKDLFAVGQDGRVWTSWLHPPQGWQPWRQVPDHAFEQTAPIAAVSSRPGQIDLFCVDPAGQIQTAWFIESVGEWQGWEPVLGGTFTPSTPVTAVSVSLGAIDLFAVGTDGGVWTAGFHPPASWQGWQLIPAGTFTQQTPVECVLAGEVKLFAVGMDGMPYMNSAPWPSLQFGGWQRIDGSPGSFAQLTTLAGWFEEAAGAPGGGTLGFYGILPTGAAELAYTRLP